jgi:cytochrome bd-type quinol oxidase subunit 1
MNGGRSSKLSVPIQGPVLTCESITAFALEASFFGVLLFFGQPVQGHSVADLVRPTFRTALAVSINRVKAVLIGTMTRNR